MGCEKRRTLTLNVVRVLGAGQERIMRKAKETKKIWKGWVDPTCTPIHMM
jgi:hypothetical protein